MLKRVVITGSSGYLGQGLIAHLRNESPELETIGLDIVPCSSEHIAPDYFHQADIRDRSIGSAIVRMQPDAIIHLAFLLNPSRSDYRARQVNLGGFRHVLQAVARLPKSKLMVCSSATVYGASATQEVPYTESTRLHSASRLRYAADKVQVERMAAEFQSSFPGNIVNVVRPTLLAGPGASSFYLRYLFNMPFLILIDGNDLPIQLVHIDDACRAMIAIMKFDQPGPYNIAPADSIRLSQIAEKMNKQTKSFPYALVYALTMLTWYSRLKMFESPPEVLPFNRYPWLIDSSKLAQDCDFAFEFSSAATFAASLPE
jgi:UDP-glucose 4-epimerase